MKPWLRKVAGAALGCMTEAEAIADPAKAVRIAQDAARAAYLARVGRTTLPAHHPV